MRGPTLVSQAGEPPDADAGWTLEPPDADAGWTFAPPDADAGFDRHPARRSSKPAASHLFPLFKRIFA
jgi:hypothetical protein